MVAAPKAKTAYPRPELNAPLVHKLLVAFVRNEFHKVGVKRAVLGNFRRGRFEPECDSRRACARA